MVGSSVDQYIPVKGRTLIYRCGNEERKECGAICCNGGLINLNPVDVAAIGTLYHIAFFLERIDKPEFITRTRKNGECILLDENDYSCLAVKDSVNRQPLVCRNFPFKYSLSRGLVQDTNCLGYSKETVTLTEDDINQLFKRVRLASALSDAKYGFSPQELMKSLDMSEPTRSNDMNINKVIVKIWNESNLKEKLKEFGLTTDFKELAELLSNAYRVQ